MNLVNKHICVKIKGYIDKYLAINNDSLFLHLSLYRQYHSQINSWYEIVLEQLEKNMNIECVKRS